MWWSAQPAADTLNAGAGDDRIDGGAGQDTLTGGAGADTFIVSALSDSTVTAPDYITDFQSGVDKIDLSRVDAGSVSIGYDGTSSYISFGTPTTSGYAGDIIANGFVKSTDLVLSPNARLTLNGGSAVETLVGGAGADLIIGGGGADTLTGGAGADIFLVGALSDSTVSAADYITDFESGVDLIDLSQVDGGSVSIGYDSTASYILFGTLTSSGYTGDVIAGGFVKGSDLRLSANAVITLNGSSLSEAITGGSGSDVIFGNGGADTLTGGAGADYFSYRALSDSTLADPDRITDFQTGLDKLDLQLLRTGQNDRYSLQSDGVNTFLYFDQGGDNVNDLLIVLSGANALTASDVVF